MPTLLTGVNDPPSLGQQYPADHPYAKGKAINNGSTTLAAAAHITADIATSGYQWLHLFGRIGNATTPATALGDLAMFVEPYEDDGTTLFPAGNTSANGLVPDLVTIVAVLNNSIASVGQRFNLAGIDKVKVDIKNNNVAALQGATAIYYLQK